LANRLTDAGCQIGRVGIAEIEGGRRRVTVDELAALGEVFGLEPWSLTGELACRGCLGSPPPGFRCLSCGAEAVSS
jgi:hypothetical protein